MRQKRSRSKNRLRMIVLWAFVFVWMVAIFLFSAQPAVGSNNISMSVTRQVVGFLQSLGIIGDNISADMIEVVNGFLRQYAHAIAYFILAILVSSAFRYSGIRRFTLYGGTFIFCAFYALTDEIHQLVVPGRAFQVQDFIYDSLGALAALALIYLFSCIFQPRTRRPGAVPRQ